MKEFRYLRKGLICFAVQLVCWLMFTFADFLEEEYNNTILFGPMVIGLPIATFALYIAFRKWFYEKLKPGVADVAIFLANWLIVAIILLVPITLMTCNWNNWIVHQATGGWENFLNGIEYPLFGIFYGGTVPIAVIIFEVVLLLIRVIGNNSTSLPTEAEAIQGNVEAFATKSDNDEQDNDEITTDALLEMESLEENK